MDDNFGLSAEEFRIQAVYSDETRQFRSPAEPTAADWVNVRLRVGRGTVSAVFLCTNEREYLMEEAETQGAFSYFQATLPPTAEEMTYYFRLQCGEAVGYYTKYGFFSEYKHEGEFRIFRDYRTPDWAKGAVMYQIYPDRFANGDVSNDVKTNEYIYLKQKTEQVTDWNSLPAASDINRFYGGDLQGVLNKLDYLAELGVEVLYFNPLFVSPSNHKYDTQDYWHIDPHFGKIVRESGSVLAADAKTNETASLYVSRTTADENLAASDALFAELIQQAHARGMRVILDGVFNHCGSFNKWLDRERIYEAGKGYEPGAYVAQDSPYHTFFKFYNEHNWPYNEFYDGWWGHDTLPKLNYEGSEKLMEDIMRIGAKWVSPPFNADGWRLDVAADLGHSPEFNHKFWKEFRRVVKEANPEAIILAEHYGDAMSWLQGDEWDTVMNYDAFMEPVSWFLTGMEKHSDEFNQGLLGNSESFIGAMTYHMPAFYAPSLYTAMNELDNHDHSRFLTRTNHRVGRVANVGPYAAAENTNKAVLREAVVIQMTWPGAPTLYYGDEAGQVGFTDPDNRRTYPWGQEDQELIRFYKEMIAVHRRFPVLAMGSLKFLYHDYNVLSYGRFNQEEQVIVVINNRNERVHVEIPVWLTGINRSSVAKLTQVFATDAVGFSSEEKEIEAPAGILEMDLLPLSGVVLHRCEE